MTDLDAIPVLWGVDAMPGSEASMVFLWPYVQLRGGLICRVERAGWDSATLDGVSPVDESTLDEAVWLLPPEGRIQCVPGSGVLLVGEHLRARASHLLQDEWGQLVGDTWPLTSGFRGRCVTWRTSQEIRHGVFCAARKVFDRLVVEPAREGQPSLWNTGEPVAGIERALAVMEGCGAEAAWQLDRRRLYAAYQSRDLERIERVTRSVKRRHRLDDDQIKNVVRRFSGIAARVADVLLGLESDRDNGDDVAHQTELGWRIAGYVVSDDLRCNGGTLSDAWLSDKVNEFLGLVTAYAPAMREGDELIRLAALAHRTMRIREEGLEWEAKEDLFANTLRLPLGQELSTASLALGRLLEKRDLRRLRMGTSQFPEDRTFRLVAHLALRATSSSLVVASTKMAYGHAADFSRLDVGLVNELCQTRDWLEESGAQPVFLHTGYAAHVRTEFMEEIATGTVRGADHALKQAAQEILDDPYAALNPSSFAQRCAMAVLGGIFKFANHEYRYILDRMFSAASDVLRDLRAHEVGRKEDFTGPLKQFLAGARASRDAPLVVPVYLGGAVHTRLIDRVRLRPGSGPPATLLLLGPGDFRRLLEEGPQRLRYWMPANCVVLFNKHLIDQEARATVGMFFRCVSRFLHNAGMAANENETSEESGICSRFWELVTEEMAPRSEGRQYSEPERYWAFAPDRETANCLLTVDNELVLDDPGRGARPRQTTEDTGGGAARRTANHASPERSAK